LRRRGAAAVPGRAARCELKASGGSEPLHSHKNRCLGTILAATTPLAASSTATAGNPGAGPREEGMMSESRLQTPEGQAFLAKLWQYRSTLSVHEQELLDSLVDAAGGERHDVERYILFGSGSTFGGTTTFGSGGAFGGGQLFG